MIRRLLLVVLASALAFRLGLWLVPLPVPPRITSILLLDRQGRPLREAGSEGRRVSLEQVSPYLVQATLAAEDHRFYGHWGVDLSATAGAALGNLRAGRVVSGGSTLTQQVVTNLCGRSPGWGGKALEGLRALKLETMLGKAEILEIYLGLVPYGNNTRGIESAARFYFGRPAAALSLAQAALLAGLPNGPTLYDPLRQPERAIQRQRWILQRMVKLGMIEDEAYQRALSEPLEVRAHPEQFSAPHFCELVLQANKAALASSLRTSLDGPLQDEVQRLVRAQVGAMRQRGMNGAAAVVLDNASGEVRALVGSPDFFDADNAGQVNLATSLRQPGSALKPFTYGLALERGMSPASILLDEEVRYATGAGEFVPSNYDGRFHGPVRLRTALASSYNVPAVRLTHELGVESLLDRLRLAGLTSLDRPAQHYGLSLTLGSGEVTLLQLCNSYRALARGGRYSPVRWWPSAEEVPEVQIFPPRVAFLLTDILSDPAARAPAFGHDSVLSLPFPCAVKTGTSRAYRDNWTLGFTTEYTVGVWAGNTGGQAMRDVSGVAGAGPLFREVMLALHRSSPPAPFAPPPGLRRGVICIQSGMTAGRHCPGRMPEWDPPAQTCDCQCPAEAVQITFPAEGDQFVIDPNLARRFQTLQMTASGPTRWRVDGKPVAEGEWPLQPGLHVAEIPGHAVHFSVR